MTRGKAAQLLLYTVFLGKNHPLSSFQSYLDRFSSSYADIKAYGRDLFQHVVPVRDWYLGRVS